MADKADRNPYWVLLLDLILLAAAFALVHYAKYGHLSLSSIHQTLLLILVLIWALANGLNGKLKRISAPRTFLSGLRIISKSALIMAFTLSFLIVAFHLIAVSRIQAYGACLLYYLFEVIGFSLYYLSVGRKRAGAEDAVRTAWATKGNISATLAAVDALLVAVAFGVSTWLKRGFLELSDDHLDILLILYGLWLIASLLTRKFERSHFSSYYSAVAPCLKAAGLMTAGLAFIIFGLRLFYLSRLQVFGAIPLLLFCELFVFYVYYSYRAAGGNIRDIENAEDVRQLLGGEQRELQATEGKPVLEPVAEKLHNALDFFNPALFTFISNAIDLSKIDRREAALFHSESQPSLKTSGKIQRSLIVNLQKINDVRWINQYLLIVHTFLREKGYLVGMAQTTDARMKLFRQELPKWPARVLYAGDFVIHRLLPKLPFTKKVYFALTKGRNRAISRAEILGRLYFCGFRAVAEMEIEDRYYFIAQKVKTPSQNPSPTYGPLVLLKRSGVLNRPITVYKFRTMHPYAEYLQNYIYEKNLLDEGGKFKNDFRVTGWGRFMRRFWLDELPMLYNWFKGDLQLVGVRPLSSQYLGLYTEELQELRSKVKPGLIPPYYADMPKTMEEIMESEKRYIQAYLAHALKTQWRYFFKCFKNIVIRRARSA